MIVKGLRNTYSILGMYYIALSKMNYDKINK